VFQTAIGDNLSLSLIPNKNLPLFKKQFIHYSTCHFCFGVAYERKKLPYQNCCVLNKKCCRILTHAEMLNSTLHTTCVIAPLFLLRSGYSITVTSTWVFIAISKLAIYSFDSTIKNCTELFSN